MEADLFFAKCKMETFTVLRMRTGKVKMVNAKK